MTIGILACINNSRGFIGPCWARALGPFICLALLGPGPCWAHSRGCICWALLGPCPGPIHSLVSVGPRTLLGPLICWALLGRFICWALSGPIIDLYRKVITFS